jgi:hypothetical protein
MLHRLNGSCALILRPIDDFEKHSALEHFAFEISGVLFPVGRLPNAKSSFLTLSFERVIGRQSPAYALVHHGEAVVGEDLIIHRTSPYRLGCDAGLGTTVTVHRAGVLDLSSLTDRTIPVTGNPFNINLALSPRYWA